MGYATLWHEIKFFLIKTLLKENLLNIFQLIKKYQILINIQSIHNVIKIMIDLEILNFN